ncbi:MAG: A24 family peptidase [Acidimicrobiales bacterium]
MHVFLVASCAAAGVVVGAVLDPVGQRLADRSRAVDERRRLDRAEQRAGDTGTGGDKAATPTDSVSIPLPVPVPELGADREAAPAADGEPGAGGGEPVRHLLASGRSIPRTVGAAIVTGALVGAAAARFGPHLILAPYAVFLVMAVTVSVTDLTHRLVPRHLVYGAMVLVVPLLVVVSSLDHSWSDLSGAAIAGAVAFGVFFVIWFVVPRGMGYGDVRLAGAIGVTVGYLSLLHAYLAFLVGFVLGLVLGLVLMVGSSAGRKTRIPFAPALCAGAAVAILWGGPLVHHLFPSSVTG